MEGSKSIKKKSAEKWNHETRKISYILYMSKGTIKQLEDKIKKIPPK